MNNTKQKSYRKIGFLFCLSWELSFVEELKKTDKQDDEAFFYITNKRSSNAIGYADEKRFIVKLGSKISDNTAEKFEINYPNAYRIRKELCSDGTIVDNVFQCDYEFDSISLAASIVLGRNARGQKEWVDADGIPFDEKNESVYDGEFNIDDESTYGSIKVGTLAFELFKKIIEPGNITDDEIENLKDKNYSKQLFSKTDYPILADNREDNRGKSNVIGYRKDPIVYKGKEVYITTQWFSANRNDIIAWYKKHLK